MGWPRRRSGAHTSYLRTPLARSDELVVEEAGDELLLYDQRTAAAHCLSGPAAAVWRACDGQTTTEQIAAQLEYDRETVTRALDELERCELLDVPQPAGITRRDATARIIKVGAAAAAASPLIYSIAAPTPALAATQKFCLSLACGSNCGATSPTGCAAQGCCCCSPGSGNNKFCSADCSPTNCNATLALSQCGVAPNNFSGCSCPT